MPVQSTAGALTYARIGTGENPNVVYWIISVTRSQPFQDLIFNSARKDFTLLSATNANTTAILTRIDGDVNPTLDATRNFECLPDTQVFNTLFSTSRILENQVIPTIEDYRITASVLANNSSSFPYYNTYTSTLVRANITSLQGGAYRYYFPFYQYQATTNQQYWAINQCIIKHSSGNVWTGGWESSPINVSGPAYPRTPFPTIKKFDTSGDQQLAYCRIQNTTGSNSMQNSTVFADLDEASDGNVIGFCTYQKSSVGTTDLIFTKTNQTPAGTPPFNTQLVNIWYTSYSNGNCISTSMKLDSTDNLYCTGRQDAHGLVMKVDTTGNMIWSKRVANTRLYDGYLKSDTEYIVTGKTSGGNLWIAQYDNTGNIVWQRQMSGTGISGNTIPTVINGYVNDIFVATNSMLIKLPANGQIIGSGVYYFSNGSSVTYAVGTETDSNFSITKNATTYFFPNDVGNTITGVKGSRDFGPNTAPGVRAIIT